MKTLVTGGAGFIGSCLVTELLQDGHDVLVYDNFSTGHPEFLPGRHPHLRVVKGDILDYECMTATMRDWQPDVVFHLAAIHYIPYCNAHRREALRVNVEGTQSVLDACWDTRVERVIAASTAAVYGISDRPNLEADCPAPVDVYGASKWFDELLIQQFCQDTGISCLVARLFNVYGPNETNPHVIPEIVQQAVSGYDIELGNLDVCRDFVYVKDVAQAFIAMASARDASFDVFNVGTGHEYSARDIVRVCEIILQRKLHARSVAARRRTIDRPHLLADCAHIQRIIGWQPRYDLQAGLAELLQDQRELQPALELSMN